jgi:hypothetical protein
LIYINCRGQEFHPRPRGPPHHTYYAKDHLVSPTYLGDEGNNTPFFFIPVFLVGACTYLLLPIDLFVVQVGAR